MFSPFPSSTILLLLLLQSLSSFSAAQLLYNICGTTGNFTANDTYQSNLDTLLSALASNASASGFASATVGQTHNQVHGLVLCRGDVNATTCRHCLDIANQDALQLCPFNKGAILWYDFCFLRFSNQQFLGSTANERTVMMANTQDVTQPEWFKQFRSQLLNATTDWAANNATKRFASGQVSIFTPENPTMYGFVQCVPDMSGFECGRCLRVLFEPMPEFLEGKLGGRVIGVTCSMRYEIYSFLNAAPTLKLSAQQTPTAPELAAAPAPKPTAPESAAAPAPKPSSPSRIPAAPGSKDGLNKSTVITIAIVIPSVSAILLVATIYICARRRKRENLYGSLYETDPEKITSVESLLFDLRTLRVATGNFSEESKLGEGGFGVVYRGELPDGREIAVKRLLNSGQGLGELKNELVLVAKLQHRNLVKLLGVCLDKEKMIVYEFVPNRSLDKFLFDPEKGQQLSWGIRYKIIRGIARGLRYLHEESQLKIIHRDLKASNILLDTEMIPKISDFGLAKLFDSDQTQGTTNRIVGTFGYMSPEYAMHGQFSMKSDVFSFGVSVLEILTGRKNTGSYNSEIAEDLLCKIWEKWNTGTALDILDPTLGEDYQASEVMRCIQIGLLCVQEDPTDRPTMSTVVVMLNAETVSLQAPLPPAFVLGHSGMVINMGSNFSSNVASFQECVKEKEASHRS